MIYLQIVILLLAILGLLTISGFSLFRVSKYLKTFKPRKSETWPTYSYMDKIGSKCPSGWVYTSDVESGNDGYSKCENKYNIPTAINNNDCTSTIKYFGNISSWKDCMKDIKNCDHLKDRCNWIAECGHGIKGDENIPKLSWFGISDTGVCNSY